MLLALSATAFSQVKVRPGVRLGLNSSSISNIDNSTNKIGLNAAAFVNIRLAKFYALQPEITYNQQGVNDLYYKTLDPYYGDYIINTTNDVEINYVGIGLANKFYIIPSFL